MKKRNIQEIIARLRHELQRAEDVDIDSLRKTEQLHRDLEQLNEPGEPDVEPDVESLSDRARELETRFAANHPTLEGIARDLADAIAKMGV
ncbi:MAG: DUF4404 family protein [Woeseia sp.]